MFNFIDFRKLTTTALLGILMAGNLIVPSTSAQDSSPNEITLTGTVRDFSDDHPDFERSPGHQSADGSTFRYGLDTNITTDNLGWDQKPVYKGGSYSTTNKANFDEWYRDVSGINESKELAITLTKQPNGVYRYENTNFFPINGEMIGNEGRSKNFHFTYELHTRFTYNGGEVFNFRGDDDVWVYINGKKVIDIGGVHGATNANVKLDDIADAAGIETGKSYTLDFFFAERHTTQSNLIIETTLELETAFVPTLWGIDEDDGQLFAMEDYTDSTSMIDYGLLKWNDNGTIRNIGTDMEAMTIDEDGIMYIALDRLLNGSGNGATLLKFNIEDATTTGNNVVEVVGQIGIDFNHSSDNVTGLSIDPITGDLFAGLKNYNSNGNRRDGKLYVINKTDGSLIREVGSISGLSKNSKRIEDIEHAPDGTLYITQNYNDHTYRVDTSNGAILEVIDNNQDGGLDTNHVKFEALGWDFANNRLIGFDDNQESLVKLTLENGNNYEYYDTTSLGLTDVEGVDFVPTIDGVPLDQAKPGTGGDDSDDTSTSEDTDGNGIPDVDEEYPNEDTDGDGVSNEDDPDDDGNGIPDKDEIGDDPDNPIDTDGDNIPDYQDLDDDNNGIDDKKEIGNNPSDPIDTDGDGTPNYQDDDDDGNGIKDKDEIGNDPTSNEGYDLDGDGTPDIYPEDSDGDGTPNYLDDDDDGNGIDDKKEIGNDPSDPIDTDGDGTPNYQDDDDDDNGIKDINEIGDDPTKNQGYDLEGKGYDVDNADEIDIYPNNFDGDEIPDYLDEDDDNDRIKDKDELLFQGVDANGNEEAGSHHQNKDSDGDSIPDDVEADPFNEYDGGFIEEPWNQDGVDYPDYLDTDSDNDTIPDSVEAVGGDPNHELADDDGYVNDPINSDMEDNTSFNDDDLPDYLDTNSDGDSWTDQEEAGDDPDSPTKSSDTLYQYQQGTYAD